MIRYPAYEISRTRPAFASREELNRYEEMLALAAEARTSSSGARLPPDATLWLNPAVPLSSFLIRWRSCYPLPR